MLTKETLVFLLGLLNMQQLHVGAPDFDDAAEKVVNAKRELEAAIAQEGEE